MRFVSSLILVLLAGIAGLAVWVSKPTGHRARDQVQLDHTRPRPQGGWYVGDYPFPIKNLNPLTTHDQVALKMVLPFTHDDLMGLDPETGQVRSAVAELQGVSVGGRWGRFLLREDARFSDGSPVTLRDIRFPFEVGQDPRVTLGSVVATIQSIRNVKLLGGGRFEIEIHKPYFAGIAAAALNYPVVKKDWFLQQIAAMAAKEGRQAPTQPGQPGFGEYLNKILESGPGTGPYRVQTWLRQERLDLVQSPYCWQRRAFPDSWNLAGMRFRIGVVREQSFLHLRQQKVDWFYEPNPDKLLRDDATIAANYRVFRYLSLAKGHEMVVWNHRRKKLRDKRVRQALTMLFNRQAIAEELLPGIATVAVSWFKPGHKAFPKDLEPRPFAPEEARRLLALAGYDDEKPLQIEILVPLGTDFHRRVMEVAKPAFLRAGVRLTTPEVGKEQWSQRQEKGEYDGYMGQWSHGGPWIDPYEFFHSSQSGAHSGYRNAEVDDLLERAQQELNEEARNKLYQRFNEIFHDEQPVTLLVYLKSSMLLHKRFEDAKAGPLGLWPQRWWVAKANRRY